MLLASRLNSNYSVFLLMINSVFLFALFPIFSRYLSSKWDYYDGILSIVLNLVCFALNDFQTNLIYSLSIVLINLIGPLLLVNIQKYKKYSTFNLVKLEVPGMKHP